jgi:hypothetical protein
MVDAVVGREVRADAEVLRSAASTSSRPEADRFDDG